MKLSKAFVSITSAAALTVSAFAMAAAVSASSSTKINDPSVTFDDSNIVVTFGAMSDTHIFQTDTSHDIYFTNALSKLQGLAGGSGKLDAVLIDGDLCENAPLETYPRMRSLWESVITSDHTELIPAIGNHDFYFEDAFSNKNSFRDLFGSWVYKNPVPYDTTDDITAGNYHTVINGVHFISVTGYDDNAVDVNLNWLDNQLAQAVKDNPYMPIFVESHVIPVDTVNGSSVAENGTETRWYATNFHTILDKYPQVVDFGGHTHANGHLDTSVWRGAYTAVGTGSTQDPACRDCKLVQVDKNGVVRMRAYSTEDDSPTSQPLNQWIFATMAPIANPPTDQDIQASATPSADILNVNFSDGTANDSASSIAAATLGNGGTLTDNTTFGKKVAAFDGSGAYGYALTDAQYDAMKASTTLSCMFNLKEAPASGSVDILGNMDNSGQGFEYTSDHVLNYHIDIGGTDVVCQAQGVEPNQWVHAVGTYDGKEVRLYVNGLLSDRKPASGDITQPAGAARVYCLGADVSSTGGYENGASVQIDSAKLFSKSVDDTEAYLIYSDDLQTQMTLPGADKYQAQQGIAYTFPTVTASDAIHGNVAVTTTVRNPSGKVLAISGSFTPSTVGSYTVTYRANGIVAVRDLTITEYQMIDHPEVTLKPGESVTLTATPADPDDSVLTWTSSDPTIATVDSNGTVTAVKEGTATITVKTIYSRTSSSVVTVSAESATTTTPSTTTSTGTEDTTVTSSTETTATGSESTATTASVDTTVTNSAGTTTANSADTTTTTSTAAAVEEGTTTTTATNAPNTGSSHSVLPYALIGLSVIATGAMLYSKKKLEQ